ncbi:MAG: hypothetical protein HQ564_02255, partial [Candidatus Saganbacteria bacterium]|nr:hypothetical protein [Candidatus Saganbacteria bacterium]
MKIILVLCLTFAFMPSPVFSFGGPPPEPHLLINLPEDKDAPVMLGINEIIDIPELEGRIVILRGSFAGWDDIGEPTPFSRRDWVLRNDSGEIYVHGPYPDGCDPMDPHSIGKPIVIT